ncbi:MAG: GspH/FimT family pseudopilin [Pseudomonadales bacterium]
MLAQTRAQYARGYSMLEGLTILLIVSLVVAVGSPPLNKVVDRSRARSDVMTLIASLSLARTTAITSGVVTTYCASADGLHCGGSWEAGTLLFHDRNDNRQIDDDDKLIERGSKIRGQGRLTWRASGRRNQYIRFSKHGMAKEFGTFTYCLKNKSGSRYARQLVLNRAGRARLTKTSESLTLAC